MKNIKITLDDGNGFSIKFSVETDLELNKKLMDKIKDAIKPEAYNEIYLNEKTSEKAILDELTKVINCGDLLAKAAHEVQSQHDGIHRLRLALSEWYKVRADEFGRGNHEQ